METILNYLPFIKVAISFLVMILGIRFRFGLGNSILAGGLLLNFLCEKGPIFWAETAFFGLLQPRTLYILIIVALIMLLSDLLEKTGRTERLMNALSVWLRRPRFRLVFFPALIGFLPMPGGAIFSAPMLKGAAETMQDKLKVDPVRMTVLNYWFRHVWEPCWPLYPGLIMAAYLSEIPIVELVAFTWPGTVVCLLAGWYFLLRPKVLPGEHADTIAPEPIAAKGERSIKAVLREGLPLFVAIIGALGLEGAISLFFPDFPFEVGMIFALAAAVGIGLIQGEKGLGFLGNLLIKKHLLQMLYVVAAIFIFKEVMNSVGVVEQASQAVSGGAALLAAAVVLPFMVGFVSGITLAFVGASFPLLIGLLQGLEVGHDFLAYIILALFSGYAGVLISPLHICFIVSCRYFHVDISKAWRLLFKPVLLFALFGFGYVFLLLEYF